MLIGKIRKDVSKLYEKDGETRKIQSKSEEMQKTSWLKNIASNGDFSELCEPMLEYLLVCASEETAISTPCLNLKLLYNMCTEIVGIPSENSD